MGTFNAEKVIRAAIPSADDDLIGFIIWNRTPYPFGKITPRYLYKKASGWRRAADNKIQLCDHCSNKSHNGKYICRACDDGLKKAMEADY